MLVKMYTIPFHCMFCICHMRYRKTISGMFDSLKKVYTGTISHTLQPAKPGVAVTINLTVQSSEGVKK